MRYLTLAAVVAVAIATNAMTASGSTTNTTTTLTLHAKQGARSFHFVDNPPTGESAGDTISFSDTLYKADKRVGFGEVTGTLLDNKRHDADNLTGTLILKNGTIALQGTSLGKARTQHIAITGGTGTYAGAHGQATITATGPATSILRLTLEH
jgi:hypothetical protein